MMKSAEKQKKWIFMRSKTFFKTVKKETPHLKTTVFKRGEGLSDEDSLLY